MFPRKLFSLAATTSRSLLPLLAAALIGVSTQPADARALGWTTAQDRGQDAAPAQDEDRSPSARLVAATEGLKFREIGPAVMGGRVADVAVVEDDPSTFYVGLATGGVWKTTSAGAAWTPVFDDQPTASIGDVTLAPSNPNVIYVGTGEPQNRQSSPWGMGVFRSTDAGRTWHHLGLEETHHIARIAVHPRDPDIAYVAAVGHLWGPNPERGVYRTTDGGETWENVLFVDDDTGAIDLVMDPNDPRTLFAATYQRRRTGFGFAAGGGGSGIWRTVDGGRNWTRLSEGLPDGDLGRIGLDVFAGDGNLVYATVEATDGQTGLYRSEDRGETWEKVSDRNPRPMYFSLVRIDPTDESRIYLGGTQLSISDDGGRTWWEGDAAEGIHVDHHALWVDPNDPDHVIMGSDGGVSETWNGGENWRAFVNMAIGQFYEVGYDMQNPYWVCGGLQDNGNWCAPNRTLGQHGVRNREWRMVWSGDGFHNRPDPTDPDIMYTESQGGFVARVHRPTGTAQMIRPIMEREDVEIREPEPAGAEGAEGGEGEEEEDEDDDQPQYRFNWNTPIVISSHDPATVYVGAHHLMRSRDRGMTWEEASPDLTKAIDRDTLTIMGLVLEDVELSRNDGISTYGNITTVAESPHSPDVLYVGTDDGNLQVTRDGGATWTNVVGRIGGLPARTYVSRIEASRHVPGRVYATFDGHRNDDMRPYVFVSEDEGESWRSLSAGLPDWSVNVIREHPDNPELLFLGNEIGVYVSADRGGSWARMDGGLPTVPVDDLHIHRRENDLIVGTHGRSIWILDDITPLEELNTGLDTGPAALFSVRPATQWGSAPGWPFQADAFVADNPPTGALIRYWLRDDIEVPADSTDDEEADDEEADESNDDTGDEEADGPVQLQILDEDGEVIRNLDTETTAGIHQAVWDLRVDPPFDDAGGQNFFFGGGGGGALVLPGKYTARLTVEGATYTTDVEVRADPRVNVSRETLIARREAMDRVNALRPAIREARERLDEMEERAEEIQEMLAEADHLEDEVREELEVGAERFAEAVELTQDALDDADQLGFLPFALESSAAEPTADNLWAIEFSWRNVPRVIERVNELSAESLPTLETRLLDERVGSDVGERIDILVPPGSELAEQAGVSRKPIG